MMIDPPAWRRLGPGEQPPPTRLMAQADIAGEPLDLSIDDRGEVWIVRWRGETWTLEGVAEHTVHSFLQAVAPDGPGDAKGGDAT